MRISVCMIVQNNLSTLPDCLASLDFADEVVIVDGGSSDGTLDYLRTYKNGYDLRLIERPWPHDFSKQRQVSFDEATCGDGTWWLRVDSDEVVPPLFRDNIHRLLGELPDSITACRVKQYNLVEGWGTYSAANGGWETYPRCWRSSRELRWEGQVHEFVCRLEEGGLVPIPDEEIANLNIPVIHTGFLDLERLKEKEGQYRTMPGSGFAKAGDLTERTHIIKEVPQCLTLGF